jgi:cell division ATPase FtsA
MFNLPFLEKVDTDTNKFLSLNINARDIRCIAFYFDGNAFKIIGSGKSDLEEGCVRNGMIIDKDSVCEAIKKSVEKATENIEDKTRKTIVAIDGGITLGLTTTVRLKRTETDPIKPNEIDELYSRIMEASYIQAHNKVLQTTGDPDLELDSITTSDIYLRVDGQNVATLEGQHGEMIEAAVYNSFAPSFHVKSIQNIIKKSGLELIALGSQMYSIVNWINNSPKNILDFVLISVAEDSTDVGVIFGGGIISSKTLNIGYLHFVESIGLKMGLSTQEAQKILDMYNQGKLASSEVPVVKDCLKEILSVWIDGIKLLFEDFSGVKTFAPKVYLAGCGAEIPDIEEILKNEPWTKTIPFKADPDISKISFSDLTKVVNSTESVLNQDWIYTASASIIYKEIMGI